jgi:hypothetical protein
MTTVEDIKRLLSTIPQEEAGGTAAAAYVLAGAMIAVNIDKVNSHLQSLITMVEALPKQERVNLDDLKKTAQFLSAVMEKFVGALRK